MLDSIGETSRRLPSTESISLQLRFTYNAFKSEWISFNSFIMHNKSVCHVRMYCHSFSVDLAMSDSSWSCFRRIVAASRSLKLLTFSALFWNIFCFFRIRLIQTNDKYLQLSHPLMDVDHLFRYRVQTVLVFSNIVELSEEISRWFVSNGMFSEWISTHQFIAFFSTFGRIFLVQCSQFIVEFLLFGSVKDSIRAQFQINFNRILTKLPSDNRAHDSSLPRIDLRMRCSMISPAQKFCARWLADFPLQHWKSMKNFNLLLSFLSKCTHIFWTFSISGTFSVCLPENKSLSLRLTWPKEMWKCQIATCWVSVLPDDKVKSRTFS